MDHAVAVALTEALLLPLAFLLMAPGLLSDSPPGLAAVQWLSRCMLWCALFLLGRLAARRAGWTGVLLVGAALFVQFSLFEPMAPAETLFETMTWLAEPALVMLAGGGFAVWPNRHRAATASA